MNSSFSPAEELHRVLRNPTTAAWADKEQVPVQETKNPAQLFWKNSSEARHIANVRSVSDPKLQGEVSVCFSARFCFGFNHYSTERRHDREEDLPSPLWSL